MNTSAVTLTPNPLDNAVTAGEFEKCKFVLFNNNGEKQDGDKEYPLMNGYIECKGFKIRVGAFDKIAEGSGTRYLSLSIGDAEQQKVYGTLYRDTKIGKEGSYYGYIKSSAATGEKDPAGKPVYETLWELGIQMKKAVAETTNRPYIGGDVYAKGAKAAATTHDEGVAF